MIDAVREALDQVVDLLVEAAGPDDGGPIRFGMQAMELGDRDLWKGGYSEGEPVGVKADTITLLTAARRVFAVSFDAGQPLRRLDVELSRTDQGWTGHAGVETVAEYRAFCRSWEPWQQRCGSTIVEAVDAAHPAEWEYASATHGRLSVRRPRSVPGSYDASFDALASVSALQDEIADAFRRSGRQLDQLEIHAIADGRSAARWNYRIDVGRAGAPTVLAPPAGPPPAPVRRGPSGPPPPTLVDQAPRTDPGRHWDRLLGALTERTGTSWLRPPADDADLARLETAFGYPLPEALRAGWLRHNGQDPADEVGRFFGMRWLSIDEIFSLGTFNDSIVVADDFDDFDEIDPDNVGSVEAAMARWLSSAPPGAVRRWYKHPGWLPVFRAEMEGAYLALDMGPGSAGSRGQMITYRLHHTSEPRVVVARDFHALLAWMDAEAAAGNLVVRSDGDEGYDDFEAARSWAHSNGPDFNLVSNFEDWCTPRAGSQT